MLVQIVALFAGCGPEPPRWPDQFMIVQRKVVGSLVQSKETVLLAVIVDAADHNVQMHFPAAGVDRPRNGKASGLE